MNVEPTTVDNDAPGCLVCKTSSLEHTDIAPDDDLTSRGLVRISATRCNYCGDVRLYGKHDDDSALEMELRGELDELAALLTVLACEELSNGRH